MALANDTSLCGDNATLSFLGVYQGIPIMGFIYQPTTYDEIYNPGVDAGAVIAVWNEVTLPPLGPPFMVEK